MNIVTDYSCMLNKKKHKKNYKIIHSIHIKKKRKGLIFVSNIKLSRMRSEHQP